MKLRSSISLLLALLTFFGLLCSCGEAATETPQTSEIAAVSSEAGDGTTADPTKDANGYTKDGLAESYNFGATITMLYDTDSSMQEFFAEETTGEAINDAIYARNASVEKRLSVTMKYVGQDGGDGSQNAYLAKAQNDAASGSSVYDIYGGYSRTIPLLAMNGLNANLLETEYFDVEKPWWPQALTDECTINDRLFFCTGDISTNLLWMMSAVFYNKNLWVNGNKGKTPEELVLDNEWTLEKFTEITETFYMDDGNGVVDTNDTFGLVAYNACLDAFLNSFGVNSVARDEDGLKLSDDFLGEKTSTIVQKLGSLFTKNCFHCSTKSAGGRGIFMDQRSLFIIDGTYIVAGVVSGTGMDFEYGIVPLPKYNSDQTEFYTNLRYPFNFYAINKMSSQIDVASAVIEAEASESYRSVTPVVFELTMKTRYSPEQVTSQMYDIIEDGVVFDFGRIYGYSVGNYYPNFRNLCIAGGNWSSTISGLKKKTNTYLKKVYSTFVD